MVWLALAGLASAAPAIPELTLDQVQARLKDKNVYVYDCNPPDVYRKAHVPGAKFLDYPNATEKDFPGDKSAMLIFYCANEH
jgi:hypothetical protein